MSTRLEQSDSDNGESGETEDFSMTEDNATREESGPSKESANDSIALGDSAAENTEAAELRGALPPSDIDADLSESQDESESERKPQGKWLDRWGPWKRWHHYRMHERLKSAYSDRQSARDREENERGRLPDGEKVEVPAIWVTELYTPSTVQGLIEGIETLGWQYGKSRNDNLAKWMNDVREGRRAGWVNLGLVSRPSDNLFMRERTAPLPSGVRAALPALMSITPSLTALIIVFLLDDDTASSLEGPLRAEYVTHTRKDPLRRRWHVIRYILMNTPVRLGHQIYFPDLIRRKMVKSRLRGLENGCVQWVRDHLRGFFSSQPNERAPTVTLLVTEKVMPLTEGARQIRAFDGLAIDRDYDAWESNEWPGARLVLPRGWDDEGPRLVFACRRQDAFPDKSGYPDPMSNWTIVQRADDYIQGLLSRWALTCLLDTYHKALSALRDQTAGNGRYRPLDDLKELRSLARTMLYDINVCTHEIVDLVESDRLYQHNVLEMTYVRELDGKNPELLTELKSSQKQRAEQVQREAALLQSTLSITSDISQMISSLRIQRLVVWLTFVSIGIALWSVYLAFR